MTITEFENIYRTLYRPLFLYAGDFIADSETCRDILADIFTRLWSQRDIIDNINLESYLRTAVRNACISHLRHSESHEKYARLLMLSKDEAESLDTVDERVQLLSKAIESLPDRTRFILEQCALNGLSYKETAELTGISPDGVKKHIVKAYASLREYFKLHDKNN